MKVLLLEPLSPPEMKWGSFSKQKGFIPPYSLVVLRAYLRENDVHVDLIDTQFDDFNAETLSQTLTRMKYDVIGIPVLTTTAEASFYNARLCRQALPEAKIVYGNVHASFLPEKTLQESPEADFVVIGEGELTLLELIRTLERATKDGSRPDYSKIKGLAYRGSDGNVIVNPSREFINDLDIVPADVYAGIELSRYVPHPTQYKRLPSAPILTHRGCPFNCIFCDARTVHGQRPRFISIDRVMDQITTLVRRDKVRSIYFKDSTFTINRGYTEELLNRIIEAKLGIIWACSTRVDCVDAALLKVMRRSGCWQIGFGIESGNQETLDFLKKGKRINLEVIRKSVAEAKRNRINVVTSFILGLPNEDEAMVKNTIRFAKELRGHQAMFYLPVPYPGTELYQICKTKGGLRENARWRDYLSVDFKNPVYVNPTLGREKMRYYYYKAYQEFYRSPLIWLQNLRQVDSFESVKKYFRGAKALMGFFHAENR